jgi:feruloyl esterase
MLRHVVRWLGVVPIGLMAVEAQAALSCADLASWAEDQTSVASAETIPATADRPAHCKVRGTIDETIGFELDLPERWNGKFLMGGGGGFAGRLDTRALNVTSAGATALQRGYATVVTDTGHRAAGGDGSWALNDAIAQENYAHRAVHRTAEVAKAMIAARYAEPIEHSYFFGCSRGGGQALTAAQRYPRDFDGIIAGAPGLSTSGSAAARIQNTQAVFPDPRNLTSPVITADNRKLLSRSALAACDTLDGAADGILDDPRVCPFKPDDLPRCTAGPAADCLTAEQLAAVKTIYGGPVVGGRRLYPGFVFGGEVDVAGWDRWLTRVEPGAAEDPSNIPLAAGIPNATYGFGTALFKYFVFSDPDWDYSTYDFSNFDTDIARIAQLLDANNPDLDAFRDGGGKLILWHGWSDAALSPLATIDYYEAVQSRDGVAREDTRLFMLPGVDHCSGGPGPDRVDWISALEQWVEQKHAPDTLLAAKQDDNGKTVRERPLCAYPNVARYDERGDPNVAASYRCAAPRR